MDVEEDEHVTEKSLRGSSQEIADNMKTELNKKVGFAGLEIEEVRITHLSYAEEIAAAMLRRQMCIRDSFHIDLHQLNKEVERLVVESLIDRGLTKSEVCLLYTSRCV